MGKVIIVTGSRVWNRPEIIGAALLARNPDLVVTGACPRGADLLAEQWAKRCQVDYLGMPARWNTATGRGAGFERNIRMLDRFPKATVLAFPEGEARGTRHCIEQAKKRGMRVEVYDSKGECVVTRAKPA